MTFNLENLRRVWQSMRAECRTSDPSFIPESKDLRLLDAQWADYSIDVLVRCR
jgi:hypothetical protein